MSASAQPDCAAACPATTNIAIILDVSLLLASILICLLVKGNSFISRITAHPTVFFESPAGDNKENVFFQEVRQSGGVLFLPCFSLFRSAGEGAEIEYHFTESEKTPMDFVNFVMALSPILVVPSAF